MRIVIKGKLSIFGSWFEKFNESGLRQIFKGFCINLVMDKRSRMFGLWTWIDFGRRILTIWLILLIDRWFSELSSWLFVEYLRILFSFWIVWVEVGCFAIDSVILLLNKMRIFWLIVVLILNLGYVSVIDFFDFLDEDLLVVG